MSRNAYRGLLFVLVTGGLTVAGVTAANAAETDGSNSIGGGNQLLPTVTAPVDLTGNAVAVLGDAAAASPSRPTAPSPVRQDLTTDGTESLLGGNQVAPDISIPITVAGNSVALLGDGSAGAAPSGGTEPAPSSAGAAHTDGFGSIAGGNQIAPALSAPITVGGNGVSVLGDSAAGSGSAPATGAGHRSGDEFTTDGSGSVLGGNQVVPHVIAPVTTGGNAVAVLGDGHSPSGVGVSAPHGAAPAGANTDGSHSLLGGNQVLPALLAPVTVGGNSAQLLGNTLHLLALPSLLDRHPLPLVGIVVGIGGSSAGLPSSPAPAAPGAPSAPLPPVGGLGAQPHASAPRPVGTGGSGDGRGLITGTVSVGGSHGGCGSPIDGGVVIGTATSGSRAGGSTDSGAEQPGACAIENASAILPRGTDSTAGVLSVAIGVLITMAAATLVLRKRMS